MILLDTHAWVWLVNESDKLSRKAASRIRNAARIGVCTMSYWEIARLVGHGNLNFDRDLEEWFDQASAWPGVEMIPMSPAIGARIAEIGDDFHGDPSDRIIAATTLALGAELVTRDEKMHAYKRLTCIW